MLKFLLSRFFPERFNPPDSKALARFEEQPPPEPQGAVPEKEEPDREQISILDAEQPVGPVPAPNNVEKSDDYYKVVLRINDKWRVIVCRDDIQWIIQFRKGTYLGKPAWRGRSYLRSKIELINHIRILCGVIQQNTLDELDTFPDWISK